MRWLEAFKECFGHRAQHVALRRYVQGVLSDSARKSMEAMLARVTEPGSYQAFQHFITDAPWRADQVWRRLRAVLPERAGLVIIDGTSFPKQGAYSVGVGRQYCGALGKVANCQVAVTAALWTGLRGYLVGAALYLPEAWLTDAARERARIPAGVRFQAKWRQALTLLRQVGVRQPLQHPREHRLVRLDVDQAACARQGRMVWRRLVQREVQELPDAQRIGRAPRDGPLRVQALKIAEQQQPDIAPRRQTRPPDAVGIERRALRLDERVEARVVEDAIQPRVERMPGTLRQIRRGDPHTGLSVTRPLLTHRHTLEYKNGDGFWLMI